MRDMPMCPMMMQHMKMGSMPMQGMPMMYMPMQNMPMANMPMSQMPMMNTMNMCNMSLDDADERDEAHFASMHSEVCQRMMPFVTRTLDTMEKKNENMYKDMLGKDVIDRMSEDAYKSMVAEMPDMNDSCDDKRQYGDGRRFTRDLIRVLLLNELLRRRRRRRRRDFDFFDYRLDEDFYYEE
jgi:hypothetical protein